MKWRRTRARRLCAFGCEIGAGVNAWVGRWRHGVQFVICRACGHERYGLMPPAEVVRDGKLESLGEDG